MRADRLTTVWWVRGLALRLMSCPERGVSPGALTAPTRACPALWTSCDDNESKSPRYLGSRHRDFSTLAERTFTCKPPTQGAPLTLPSRTRLVGVMTLIRGRSSR